MRLLFFAFVASVIFCFSTDVELLAQKGGYKPVPRVTHAENTRSSGAQSTKKGMGCGGGVSHSEPPNSYERRPEVKAEPPKPYEFRPEAKTEASKSYEFRPEAKAEAPSKPAQPWDIPIIQATPTFNLPTPKPVKFRELSTDESVGSLTLQRMLIGKLITSFEIPRYAIDGEPITIGQISHIYTRDTVADTRHNHISGDSFPVVPFMERPAGLLDIPKDGSWLGATAHKDFAEVFLKEGSRYFVLTVTHKGFARWDGKAYTATEIPAYLEGVRNRYNNRNIALLDAQIDLAGKTARLCLPDVATPGKEIKIDLNAAELASLQKGEQLPSDHPFHNYLAKLRTENKPLMLFSHPFQARSPREAEQLNQLTFDIQSAYWENRVYRDPMSDQTPGHVAGLSHLKALTAADIKVVIGSPDDIQRADVMKTIENIRSVLDRGPLKPVPFGPNDVWKEAPGKTVIVITGHSAKELADFVDRLGNAGVFRDNYVVFNSCETPLTVELIERINGVFGAAGLFGFNGKIPLAKAGDLVKDLADWLKNGGGSVESTLRDKLRTPKRNLNGVWIFSRGKPLKPTYQDTVFPTQHA